MHRANRADAGFATLISWTEAAARATAFPARPRHLRPRRKARRCRGLWTCGTPYTAHFCHREGLGRSMTEKPPDSGLGSWHVGLHRGSQCDNYVKLHFFFQKKVLRCAPSGGSASHDCVAGDTLGEA